jgi:GNAT superfamily N-acetyltransferase
LEAFTAAERRDLWELARNGPAFHDLWPEYNGHGNNTGRYFGSLFPDHAHFQVLFVDRRSDRLVARGRTIPLRWDGTLEDLPAGIDAAGLRAVDEPGHPTALSALAAEVERDYQGQGLSGLVLRAMGDLARNGKLAPLLAPVRPSWKDRYPLIPIEDYAAWHRDDGLPFDPWMRVHARLGARIVRAEPRSLQIFAPVSDWETWTGMSLPADGLYVFPEGLAPLAISEGQGEYFEPNVWMLHDI